MPILGMVYLLCITKQQCANLFHFNMPHYKKSNLITRRFKWVVLQMKKIWQEIEDPASTHTITFLDKKKQEPVEKKNETIAIKKKLKKIFHNLYCQPLPTSKK